MARASVTTWLPLDEWAKIMGYSRWSFNGIAPFPQQIGSACDALWQQYPEQYDTLSREELAFAIRQAEDILKDFLNYNLLPDWRQDIVYPPRFHIPEYTSHLTVRGRPKSVQLPCRKLIGLGTKRKTLLEAGATITRVDKDGDGFNETAQVTVTDTVDQNQLRVYYPGESGADEWEIRPTKYANTTTLEFPIWQIVKPEYTDGLAQDPLDGYDNDIYLTTVDVYQVNTNTDTPITLVYEDLDCITTTDCAQSSFTTCGIIRNEKLGYVIYNPSLTYDPTTKRLEPDKIQIDYYSGWMSQGSRPLLELDPYWKAPIAYLAASLLDRDPADCMGGQSQTPAVSQWRQDLALEDGQTSKSYKVNDFMLANPFGVTTKGAWYAYQRAIHKVIR